MRGRARFTVRVRVDFAIDGWREARVRFEVGV